MAIMMINPFISFPTTGGGGYNPSDYGTVWGWYDATQETAYSDTNSVPTLQDFSGNGRNVTQGTGTAQAIYNTSVQNGNSVFTFDGGDYYQPSSDQRDLAQVNTIVFVCSADLASPTTNQFLCDGRGSSARNAVYTRDSASDNFALFAGTEANARGYTTDPVILTCVFNGNSSFIRLNGSQSGNVAAGSQGLDPITIGARFNGVEGWNGWIGEVVVYDDSLTSTEISNLESDLSTKWGITV